MSAPVATVGAADVQRRIAEIRQRFEPARPATRVAAEPSSFADALTAALAGGGATGLEAALGAGDGGAASFGASAVEKGMEYLGVPYLWGGTDPDVGLDCSGFVQLVYRQLGVELPRVSRDQARAGVAVPSLDQARPGDLIAFGSPVDHIAIYVGDGKILHAPRTGDVVKVTEIHRTPTAIRRVAPTGDAAPAVGPVALTGGLGTTAAGGVLGDPAVARYASLFAGAGRRHGIDPAVLAAVAKVESGGNPAAVSPAGARGLMQFMPATAAGYGIDPMDPAQAIDAAARMLADQTRSLGTLELALAAYNAGPGAVRRHGGIPPYSETQNYVRKVMSLVNAS